MSHPSHFGRYQVHKVLGQGAMGVIYLAEDPIIGRQVAIKAIQVQPGLSQADRQELRSRFEREFRLAGTLSHPNVVTVFDVGYENEAPFIAMEYVPGKTLEALLNEQRAFSFQQLVDLVLPICGGLDYAHTSGIVHRDVKPANILITGDGRPKITDFGVAKLTESGMTRTGAIIGTPWYMSPEQITGQPVSGAADQFSLAVMVYELLTGEKPFTGERSSTIFYKIVHTDPVHPRVLNQRLSEAIDAVLMRALDKNPDQRFPSCFEFGEALRQALGVQASTARTLGYSTTRLAEAAEKALQAATPEPEDRLDSAETMMRDTSPGTKPAAAPTPLPVPSAAPPAPAAPPVPVSAAAKPAPGAAKPTVAAPAAAGSRRLAILSGALAAAALVAAGVFFWREVAPSAPEVETLEPAPHPVRRAQLKRRAPPAPAAPANPALPPPPPPELFTIQSKPSGAKLIIDGEVLEETTPVEIELDPREKYSLKLELDGYETTGFSFKLTDLKPEQRQKRSLFFPLKAKPAPEVADATPAPAVPSSPAPPVAPTPAERDAPAPAGSGSKALIDPKAPRVRAGAQVDTPRRVVDVKPVVSKSDIKDGVVILELLIDTAGNVAEVKVLRSLTPALDQAAVTAASQWRYEPSVYKGKPANVVLSTTVRFIEK